MCRAGSTSPPPSSILSSTTSRSSLFARPGTSCCD
jgi:hypothetical protein